MNAAPERWVKQTRLDEDTVVDSTVDITYSRRAEDGKPPEDYVTLRRAQVERFLTEAGYNLAATS